MPDLSAAQQITVKRLLGYSVLTEDIDVYLVGLSAEALTEATRLLTQIAAVEAAMDAAATEGGRFERVEDVHFRGPGGLSQLQDRLVALVTQLANLLGAHLSPRSVAASGGSVSSGPFYRG